MNILKMVQHVWRVGTLTSAPHAHTNITRESRFHKQRECKMQDNVVTVILQLLWLWNRNIPDFYPNCVSVNHFLSVFHLSLVCNSVTLIRASQLTDLIGTWNYLQHIQSLYELFCAAKQARIRQKKNPKNQTRFIKMWQLSKIYLLWMVRNWTAVHHVMTSAL